MFWWMLDICCPTVDKIVNHIYEVNHMDDQLDLEEVELDDEQASIAAGCAKGRHAALR